MSSSDDEFDDIAEVIIINDNIGSPNHASGTRLLKAINAEAATTGKALTNVMQELKDIASSNCGPVPSLGSPMHAQHNADVKAARKAIKTETVTATVDN